MHRGATDRHHCDWLTDYAATPLRSFQMELKNILSFTSSSTRLPFSVRERARARAPQAFSLET